MINTLLQLAKLGEKIEDIDKKLQVIQEDMLILKAKSGLEPREGWGGFSLGDK